MQLRFDEIKQAANAIGAINDRFGYARDIAVKAREIARLADSLADI